MKLEMHAHDCEVSQCAVITAKDLWWMVIKMRGMTES